MPIQQFRSISPTVAEDVFIAPTAFCIGDVTIRELSSVFFGAVLRGDILSIRVGARSNIQEHALLHTSHGQTPCVVGDDVTIGHGAIVHGCTIENASLVGMGATILDGAIIGSESIVGAQSLVPLGMKIPPRTLALGVPAKVIRPLTDAEIKGLYESARHYVDLSRNFIEA